jgi:hypothetical protein
MPDKLGGVAASVWMHPSGAHALANAPTATVDKFSPADRLSYGGRALRCESGA